MPIQKFRVKGLRLEDETSLQARVKAVPGVLFALVSAGGECLEVEFEDDEVTPAQIVDVVAELGCSAELAG